jgi:hypothetical protein
MATANSPDSARHAAADPVLSNGEDHELAAGWMKPALSAKDMAERHLVKANEGYEQILWQAHELR